MQLGPLGCRATITEAHMIDSETEVAATVTAIADEIAAAELSPKLLGFHRWFEGSQYVTSDAADNGASR